jgi:hypothetical protein
MYKCVCDFFIDTYLVIKKKKHIFIILIYYILYFFRAPRWCNSLKCYCLFFIYLTKTEVFD